MPKCHDAIHGIKNHRMIKHAEVVQFAEVFDLCNPSLVELEIILFQAEDNVFQNVVNDCNDKILVVSIQGARENGK
jgi:hypothetical protein